MMFQNQKERQLYDDRNRSNTDENTSNSTLYGSSYATVSWIDDRCREIGSSLKNDYDQCISEIRNLGAQRLFRIMDEYGDLIDSEVTLIDVVDDNEYLCTIDKDIPICDSLDDVKIIMSLRDFRHNGYDPIELADRYPDVLLQVMILSDQEVVENIIDGTGHYEQKDIVGIQVLRDLQTKYKVDICDFIDCYSDLIISNRSLVVDGQIVTESGDVPICRSIEDANDIMLLRRIRILNKSIQLVDYFSSSSKEKGRMVGKIEHHVREHLSGRIDRAYNDVANSDMCRRMGGLKNV